MRDDPCRETASWRLAVPEGWACNEKAPGLAILRLAVGFANLLVSSRPRDKCLAGTLEPTPAEELSESKGSVSRPLPALALAPGLRNFSLRPLQSAH
jgi:hypothetical protein